MPQGRRKVPFSGKQKKLQLQKKRERKQDECGPACCRVIGDAEIVSSLQNEKFGKEKTDEIVKFNEQPTHDGARNANRYRIHFKKESEEELKARKEEARKSFKLLPEESLEVCFEDIYGDHQELDIPKRPPHDYIVSKYELEAKEQKYFREYLEYIEFRYKDKHISYFEMNLETWRQLWRVLEMSDIILIIVDIRHPIVHFPPGLYRHVTEDLKKDVILVLSKIDLVPSPLVVAWYYYFQMLFPKLHIMCFAAFACASSTIGKKGYKRGKLRMATDGAKHLLEICEQIVRGAVDLSSWHQKIKEEKLVGADSLQLDDDSDNIDDDEDDQSACAAETKGNPESEACSQMGKYRDGILTIGCIGHPNVGKSALLNAVVGKKVVSVSRTPGHTKHFQTIFLTPTVRLCDCPGLVFPSMIPKPMQVLAGMYPIAQLREPYTAMKYLAERVNIPQVLKLHHPEEEGTSTDFNQEWSAYDICEAWAEKRGFRTSRAARLDTYRAANNLLRMALDGRTICLAFSPPGYMQQKDSQWICHPSLEKIERIQGEKKLLPNTSDQGHTDEEDTDYSTEEEKEEEANIKSSKQKDVGTENRFALLF